VSGVDDKHFNRPQDIAWLPDGSLLVADGLGNARIAKFDRNGAFVTSWGSRGNGPGQLSGPHGIATDRNRRVYVADRTNHRIQIFDENGRYLDQRPGLRQPNDILIDAGRHLWVADSFGGRTQKFRPRPSADRTKLIAPTR
jgi:DNA-binding beta-propeller fold protein YncE